MWIVCSAVKLHEISSFVCVCVCVCVEGVGGGGKNKIKSKCPAATVIRTLRAKLFWDSKKSIHWNGLKALKFKKKKVISCNGDLTFTTLWANSADDKLVICFLFSENMKYQILFSGKNKKKTFQNVIC